MIKLFQGNCLPILKNHKENSVDAIVTDPPYGIKFMGKKWDYEIPSVEIWRECLRVLKPGGFLLSFAGTRTQHRMACNIEDAGFEIRDMIAWVYGSGFPKSHNIGKSVDKLQGNERKDLGESENNRDISKHNYNSVGNVGSHARLTEGDSEWEGWGTSLKPALEPLTLARKPLSEKTIAKNVLKWGTGGINIDGCRVDLNGDNSQGRFPANLIHDGSEEVEGVFPSPHGAGKKRGSGTAIQKNPGSLFLGDKGSPNNGARFGDFGSASRFFYCAKTSKKERNAGLDDVKNTHPTVKPIALMRYLSRLVTPVGGIILDPFMGSGSGGIAAKLEGFSFVGIELEEESYLIAEERISNVRKPLW